MRFNPFALCPLKEVGFTIIVITVTIGSIVTATGTGKWYIHYLYTFVYTLSCSLFISLPLCNVYLRIWKLPRALYYTSFLLTVLIGAFLGMQVAHLVIYRSLFIDKRILFITLLISFITTSVIAAYRHIQTNLEQKISRIKEIELENETLRRYELEARLSSLQSKLNPHFLFNTLNSLAALVYDDPTRAEHNIVRLSDLYRRVLTISENTYVPISEEIALIADYIELENQGFDGRLTFEIQCPEELKERKIPGLILEPLVENAIKHNAPEDPLVIQIDIGELDSMFRMDLRDNGRGFDVATTSFGFGLYGIQQRLTYLYGDQHKFAIDSKIGVGTRVLIGIPSDSGVTIG